jgi:hypothetical protein
MSKQSKSKERAWAPAANPLMAAGMRAIRSSNKAGPHADGRHRRARTHQALMLRISREL